MKAVVDRVVQYTNRYQLTNVETGEVLGTFDFEEVTGTVQQVGTEIDKELFDSIANDLAARVKLSGGELAGTIVTFSDISGTAANVASGDTSATLWGKVKNWFSRLKALAFKNKVAAGDFEAGAIKNADVAADAAIAQGKVSGLMTDYVASISVSGRTVTYKNKNGVNMGSITTQDTTYGLASQSSNGLMSSTDKTKLDGIESGAQKNTVLGVKGSSESAYRTGNVNITKANIGLGNVDNTSDADKPVSTATQTALNGKANTSGTYPNLSVGSATTATNADAATAVPATHVPNGTDINTYRGENYWGKTFYAGGNNTVQNTPIAGIAFSLEVLRSGAFATVQRISMLAVGSNNQPTVYTRSVSDSTTTSADGAWTAWTEVAEASGTYPDMTVGKAQESNNNLLLNGDFKLNTRGQSVYVDDGNSYIPCVDNWEFGFGDCTLTVLSSGGLQITKKSGETNPSNLQTSDIKNSISAAGKYIVAFKVDALSSVAQVYCRYITQSGTQYVTVTSNNDTQNNIAIITFTLTDEQVTAIKQSEKLVIGIQKTSTAESLTVYWAKLEEGDVSTAPNGLVQNATEALYAKTAECLGKQVNINQSNTGWVKVAYVSRSSFSSGGNYSCIMLVNGIYNVQGQSDAAESGIIELDIRDTGSAIQYYGINALSGNINVNEWCATADSDGVTVYVSLPAMYQRYLITVISEAWQTGLNVDFITLFNEYYGSTAPSGAVYAQVRNNASGDEDGNNIKETYAKKNGTYPNMTVGNSTNATNATNATHAASADNATNATNATTASKLSGLTSFRSTINLSTGQVTSDNTQYLLSILKFFGGACIGATASVADGRATSFLIGRNMEEVIAFFDESNNGVRFDAGGAHEYGSFNMSGELTLNIVALG